MKEIKLSVVIPVYDEVSTVSACLTDIVETLAQSSLSFEIVAVNDGSQDGTEEALLALLERYPDHLRVASHVRNKGMGAALRTGTRLARGEIVVWMDADGQHKATDILKLIEQIPPYDMVIGARTSSYEGAWYRNIANRFYNWFASWLTESPILDLTSGFRAMRRSAALHFLPLFPAGFSSSTTITLAMLKAGYSIIFVPINVQPRTQGKSKITLFKDGRRFVLIILRMIMLFDPLRVFLPVTLVLFILGVVTWIVGIIAASRPVVPGSTVVLFIAAILSMLLGLVSTQISNALIAYHGDEFVYLHEKQDTSPDAS